MDLGITGRAAIVTGGSKGRCVGPCCPVSVSAPGSVLLLAEGANVCAVSRDITLLDELVASSAGHLVTASCDLTTVEGCDLAAKACLDAFDRIDILVNCAGSAGMGNILEISADDVDDALLLKFHGYLRMAQRVIPSMTVRRWGRIVNIAGTSATADNLPTSLANIAVHNLTRALSDELTSSGIQVNLVAPGMTLTDRAVTLVARAAEQQDRSPQELIAEVGSGLPAGRAADPAEVARVVCFLAPDACSYVQASVLYMDGGARRATP